MVLSVPIWFLSINPMRSDSVRYPGGDVSEEVISRRGVKVCGMLGMVD